MTRMKRFTDDLTGQTFRLLTAIRSVGKNDHGHAMWECRCACGTIVVVRGTSLTTRNNKSCGCHKYGNARKTHGKSLTPEHIVWKGMRSRCERKSDTGYKNYGARGISVCKRWKSFQNFLDDMGLKPTPEHSIDRIDNDGKYEPGNCRWATRIQQANNTRTNVFLEHDGKKLTVTQWAAIVGIQPKGIMYRLKRGMSVSEAVTRPSRTRKKPCTSPLS